MKKSTRDFLLAAAGIASFIGHQNYQNKSIKVNYNRLFYPYLDEKLENYRICHISDLHSGTFGKDNSKLADIINNLQPRVLCMTGDMIDDDLDDGENFIKFLEKVDKSIIRLFVSGNHETYTTSGFRTIVSNRTVFYNKLKNVGVHVLHNTEYKDEEYPIRFSGTEDNYLMYQGENFIEENFDIASQIQEAKSDYFNVALVHRPNYFRSFASYGYQLMLSGHTHGGIIRIYGLGGLLSPDATFFPEFDKGLFRYEDSYLNVSSGLSSPKPIPKFGNRPEVNIVTLHKGNYRKDIPVVLEKETEGKVSKKVKSVIGKLKESI